MPPLFLNENDKKEMTENVQISASSFLNETSKTLNATRFGNNNNGWLGFVLKGSLFSRVSLKSIWQSMMEF